MKADSKVVQKKKGVDFTARRLLREGDRAFRKADLLTAKRLYLAANQNMPHSPADYRLVHQKLVQVNRELGHWREWVTGNLLLISAPFGSFQLLSRLRFPRSSAQSGN